MRNLYRTITEWSVALSGLLLFSCTLGWVLFDGDDALVDLIEVSLPALVGISFLIGGVWLARTHQALRVSRLSLWTAGGAITGVAVNVWNRFVISLEHMPAGEPIPLTLNDAGIFMAASVLLGYYATGLQQREQELAESESRFRALTENSSFAVVTIDETSTIQYANDAVKDLFGYSSAALVGDTLTKLMPEQLQGAHRDGVTQYLSAGDRTIDWDGIEIRGQRADGEEFPIEISFGEYVVDDDHLFTGVIQDISGRKEAERQLRTHTAKVTQLHDLATDITGADSAETIYQHTADGAVDLFDADIARLSVVEGNQLVPAASSGSGTVDDRDPVPTSFGYAGETYQSGTVLRVDGLEFTRSAATSPIQDGGAQPDPQTSADPRALLSIPLGEYGVLQVFSSDSDGFAERDEDVAEMLATHVVTALERLSAGATIRRERDRLEEFASILSHDLRNPLNVAQGRLDFIEVPDDDGHLNAVERALDRMERLIDDMLTLARQGDAVGETATIALDALATQAWENVATDAATLEIEADLHFDGDRSRLVQMFENLYRNAIEHGVDAVTIHVGVLDAGDGFYIEDTGPGIPETERKDVFESGYTTNQNGTGFGLAIVSRIVEAHGWDIKVTDGTDGGARFEISGVQSASTPL
ncbi:PAS domain-containing sensor histidine kinase [Haloferax sp. KTX1]|uniref:sensor histidine kinase n=1 Tax=Haloferax sp. KTX1 TaxID=2600597 RepID=UPI0011DCDB42|nr:PAS domain S-box protein [Haloferax sp. KTX1]